jgi:hypothetical protein
MALENPDLPGLPDDVRKEVLNFHKNLEGRPGMVFEIVMPNPDEIITVWDRRSYKKDLVTGREIPDESKRIPLLTYKNPRPAEWPQADYIVGNPPFIGDKVMREALGSGYVDALRQTYPSIPESADFVMFWWYKAAELLRANQIRRFGLITTNSLRQTFNRRILRDQLEGNPPMSLSFAISDHPWVDEEGSAAVRIAMTVGQPGNAKGSLFDVVSEQEQDEGSPILQLQERQGFIQSDLSVSDTVGSVVALKANDALSVNGMMLAGRGFVVSREHAKVLGLGKDPDVSARIKPLMNGKDITDRSRELYVIDLFGLTAEEARAKVPRVYQHVLNNVKPERDTNARPKLKNEWWLFGEPRKTLRRALRGLSRYIVTVETAKHRVFQFLETLILPEHKLVAIGLEDAFFLGVLSSRIHVLWALARGALLEDRPVYPKSECFDPFPFPDCAEAQRERIRKIAEELDAHRKRVQAQHPGLTLTGMYNVLEKLRANQALTAKEKDIHDKGLVSVLKQLHDDLDAAVFDAYGWPKTLTDAEILERLVALNSERAREEAAGQIRWLRPEYQIPLFQKTVGGARSSAAQTSSGDTAEPELNLPAPKTKPAKKTQKGKAKPEKAGSPRVTLTTPTETLTLKRKQSWPKSLPERAKAVESMLGWYGAPATPAQIAFCFQKPRRDNIPEIKEILETLCALGRARRGKEKGTYTT